MKKAIAIAALAATIHAASLQSEIEKLIDSAAITRNAFWGIQVMDLASGQILYENNANHFFVPASNTKLFTMALALMRLGPDHKFVTRVVADSALDAKGTVSGALRLVGGGDPNLSARAIPYRMGPTTGDPLAAIQDLADQVAAAGVKRVNGGIIGDDSWYVWQPYAAGWGIEDPETDDGPPISALTINDNSFTLRIRPGAREGDPAALELIPPVEFYRIDNRVITTGREVVRKVSYDRVPASRDLRIWGTIPLRDRGLDLALAIEDPALYAAQALRAALESRGIAIEGETAARHLYPADVPDLKEGTLAAVEGTELARRSSAPLLEDLRVTAKVSQNLHAELALRAVGRARRGVGSFDAGLEEMKSFLEEVQIPEDAVALGDGSGLARRNLVTPAAIVKLLQFMYASRYREEWIGLLPVAGQDGSLSGRFGDNPAAGRVFAKTGSLAHVSALSGYLRKNGGGWVAFSILVNNFNGRNADVRGVMDRICALIME